MDLDIKELYIPAFEEFEKSSEIIKNHYKKFSKNLREFISEKEEFKLFFYERTNINNILAKLLFKFGEIIDIQFSISKAKGSAGERITYYLKDMPREEVLKALNEYFGKVTFGDGKKVIRPIELSRSYFLRSKKENNPFVFSIARVIDGSKGINYEINSGFDSNRCDLGADINNYILLRSLDADSIPYHTCVIDRSIILEALNNLNPYWIGILEAWYELNFTSNKDVNNITEDILNKRYSSDPVLYKIALNLRQSALNKLIKNIIKIQDLKDNKLCS